MMNSMKSSEESTKSSQDYIPGTPDIIDVTQNIKKGLESVTKNVGEWRSDIATNKSSDSNDFHLHLDTQSDSFSDPNLPSSASACKEMGKPNGVVDHDTSKKGAIIPSENNGRRLVEYDQISEGSCDHNEEADQSRIRDAQRSTTDSAIQFTNDKKKSKTTESGPDEISENEKILVAESCVVESSDPLESSSAVNVDPGSPLKRPELRRRKAQSPFSDTSEGGAVKRKTVNKNNEDIIESTEDEEQGELQNENSSTKSKSKRARVTNTSESTNEEGEGKRSLRNRNTSPTKKEPSKNMETEKEGNKQSRKKTPSDSVEESSAKKRGRQVSSSERSAHLSSASEDNEPRQLRKRPPPPQQSTTTTPKPTKNEALNTPTKSSRASSKVPISEKPSTPKTVPKQKNQQPTSTAKKKGSNFHKKQQDLYEFDDSVEDVSPMQPLKHVQLARGNFMEMKFTKASNDDEDDTPKFAALSQSAEKRRQESFKSPRISSPSKLASSGNKSDSSKRGYLPMKKDSLSPGELGDISSLESKRTCDSLSTMPKSTPSSGLKPSLDITSSTEKSATDSADRKVQGSSGSTKRASSSSSKVGSQSLFSDIEAKVCDDFDNEDFLSNLSNDRAVEQRAPTNRRKQNSGQSDSDDEADDLKVLKPDSDRSTKKRGRPALKSTTPKSRADSTDTSPVARKKSRPQLTPKPREPQLPEMTPEEQLVADLPIHSSPHLLPGARVLAKWVDKDFYPGNIVLELGLGRYKVKFLDGHYRDMPAPDIVPIARLKSGDKLMYSVELEDNVTELQPVEITQTPSVTDSQEWYAGLFEVHNAIKDQTEKVSWQKFVIDEDQTKAFVSDLNNMQAYEVVADNINESRVRRNRGKRAESPVEENIIEVQTLPKRRTTGTPKRATPRPPSSSAKKRRTDTSAGSASSPRPSRAELAAAYDYAAAGHGTSGELAENRMFEGLKFVLTSANRVKLVNSENSEDEKPLIPFNKKQMRQMIDHYGGSVVDEFATLAETNQCFLIADQYYRTHKYLSALARAVPCVSHIWIHDCCSKDTRLPFENYMLPAGQSLESNRIIEWHNDCPKLLSGLRVFVYTENRPSNPGALDFVQIWAPLVKCMGAKLLDELPDTEDDNFRVNILLTDISCPNHVLSKAAKLGADAVSSEWLIQAIITGQRPAANGHPKYRYDYVEQVAVAPT